MCGISKETDLALKSEEKERAFSNSIPRLVSDSVDIWKRQAGGDVEYVQGTLDASMRNLGIGCYDRTTAT